MSRAVLLTAAMLMALALPASAEPRVVCTLAIETGAKDPLVRCPSSGFLGQFAV